MLERLKAEGEGDDRGWDGWMASRPRWACVWASSGCWWWIGKAGVLQPMGWQRVGHDWASELNWSTSFADALWKDLPESQTRHWHLRKMELNMLGRCDRSKIPAALGSQGGAWGVRGKGKERPSRVFLGPSRAPRSYFHQQKIYRDSQMDTEKIPLLPHPFPAHTSASTLGENLQDSQFLWWVLVNILSRILIQYLHRLLRVAFRGQRYPAQV